MVEDLSLQTLASKRKEEFLYNPQQSERSFYLVRDLRVNHFDELHIIIIKFRMIFHGIHTTIKRIIIHRTNIYSKRDHRLIGLEHI